MKFNLEKVELSYVDRNENLYLPQESSIELAEILGILAGDGHIGSSGKGKDHIVQINSNLNDELPYLVHVAELFKKVFNAKLVLRTREKDCTAFIAKKSKGLVSFLENIGFEKRNCLLTIPNFVWENEKEGIFFIRGIFDTDGSICLKKNHGKRQFYPVINITLKDEYLIRKIQAWTLTHSIHSVVCCDTYTDKRTGNTYQKWRFEVNGHRNVQNWILLVGASNEKSKRKLCTAGIKMGVPGFEPGTSPASAV